MVKIILVRHGETEWNQLRRVQGANSNTELSQRGRQQAESLALRLKPERIEAIYSSPLQRALDTARAIADYHQVEITIEPDLKEIDVGELEGIPLEKIGKHLDQLLITSQGETLLKMPGGESLAAVQQRAWSIIQRLITQHSDGVIVVVSHYFVILTIICSVLKLPVSQISRLRLGVGSISTITFDGQVPRLLLFNDCCHLTSDKPL